MLEYADAARPYLPVPTPEVSVATTPVFDTKLVIAVGVVLAVLELPKPSIALSPPYVDAAHLVLSVPTPAVSVATTPVFDTKLVTSAILSLPR